MENYYKILGVAETATLAEIKLRYKKLAKELHPDINPSLVAEERFKVITTAYTILSNQNLRRQFDVRLAQARLHAMRATIKNESNRRPRNKKYPYRPKPTKTTINVGNERKANFYAIAFVAFVAVVVLLSINIYKFYQEWKLDHLISNFDHQVEQADSLFYSGRVQAALLFVDSIKDRNKGELNMKRYEINYLNFRKDQADIDFKNKAYKDALWGYLFYMEYTKNQNTDLQYRLAVCYRGIQEPAKAIMILNVLMKNNYKRIRMIELIADTYLSDVKDTAIAKQYYQMGLESVVNQFKSNYGNAYRLLVSAERTPQAYKNIYFKSAEIYYQEKKYIEAAKLLEWVIFFEPKNEKAYEYLIYSYFQLKNNKEACSILRKAEKSDIQLTLSIDLSCNS